MTGQHELQQNLHPKPLAIRALQGAGIALVLVNIFILVMGGFSYERIYMPMATVTIGGAFGGIFYYILNYLQYRIGWNKVLINIFGPLAYVGILYFSLIAGLAQAGYWD